MTCLKVGITGNIGSGKSTVCALFSVLGVPVYHADERAKFLLNHDTSLQFEVKKLLGTEVYTEGQLNRVLVAQKVFQSPELLKAYNELVHPRVLEDSRQWFLENDKFPYVLKEAALLFESGSYKDLSFLITVAAPESVRIERVKRRDSVSGQQVMDRIKYQWNEERKIALSNAVIINDGKEMLVPQVWNLHHQILKMRLNDAVMLQD